MKNKQPINLSKDKEHIGIKGIGRIKSSKKIKNFLTRCKIEMKNHKKGKQSYTDNMSQLMK